MSAIFNREINKRNRNKTFLCVLFTALLFRTFTSGLLGATLSSVPCIIIILSVFFMPNATKGKKLFIIVSSIFTTIVLLVHGILEAKDCALFFFSFISLEYFAKHFSFGPNELYKYIMIVMMPQILYYMVSSGMVSAFLPNPEGLVDLSCGFGTKHYTGGIGYLCFIAALYYIHLDRITIGRINRFHICLFLLGIYLTIFSSSRSYTLGMLTTMLMYYANRKSVNKTISWIIFVTAISSTFFMEMLSQWVPYISNIDWLADFIHIDNFEKSGVTSGRDWLWGYHMQWFITNPLFGGGREAIDLFVGDWIGALGIEAKAGSESPFTSILACYGFIGIVMLSILILLFKKAIDQRNVMAVCIMFSMLYNSTMGTNQTSVLIEHSIVLYLLFFTSLYSPILNIESNTSVNKKYKHTHYYESHCIH